jgi:hypothetical protein
MKISHLNASAFALALFAAIPASAASVSINFDNVASGANANSAAPAGVSFHQAIYSNDVDEYGIEIPNTEKFRVDPTSTTAVTVANPALNDYGSAPSGANALDAREQPILMHFDTAQNVNSFSLILDNSSYGNPWQSSLYFLNVSKAIIGQVDFDQTILGLIVNMNIPLNGVQEILLSSGAFYDNITFSSEPVAPVPLPAALILLMSGLGLLGVTKRLKKPD